jgi:hypothetical protein
MMDGLFPGQPLVDTISDIAHSELINDERVLTGLVSFLRHSESEVRAEAIRALPYHGLDFKWDQEPGKTLHDDLIVILRHDPDRDCRRGAASAIGALFGDTSNREMIKNLWSVCANPTEEDNVRAFAYSAILSTAGVPVSEQPSPVGLKIGPKELQQVEQYFESQ